MTSQAGGGGGPAHHTSVIIQPADSEAQKLQILIVFVSTQDLMKKLDSLALSHGYQFRGQVYILVLNHVLMETHQSI